METIGAFDAKTRLSELLERASCGESFEITKRGKPVARLVPVNDRDPARISDAVLKLRSLRGRVTSLSQEALLATIHEGHER